MKSERFHCIIYICTVCPQTNWRREKCKSDPIDQACAVFQEWIFYLAFGRLNKVSENISQCLNLSGKSFFSDTFKTAEKFYLTACHDFCKMKKSDVTSGKLYTRKEGILNGTRENYREDK